MTHFTAHQLGFVLLGMFKAGQKKALYEVSNFIKRNPEVLIHKVIKYIRKTPIVEESQTISEKHQKLVNYPTLEIAYRQLDNIMQRPTSSTPVSTIETLRGQNKEVKVL
ncbi:hypothetical protein ABPG72_008911 [Tetrahymena utriculariae]